MILTIRTDKPEAEIGLFDPGGSKVSYVVWQAHRQLSETILVKIKTILDEASLNFNDLTGIVFYEGPGSFTGLRIGASVANAMQVPVVNSSGPDWEASGIISLRQKNDGFAIPKYGSEPHTTKP